MSEFPRVRKVTPTFQAVLNHEIKRVMDDIYAQNWTGAYSSLRTLIDALKQEHAKNLLENDVSHIESELEKVRQLRGVDDYTTRVQINEAIDEVLAFHVRPLFRKVMHILHEYGYLERLEAKVPEGHALDYR